jgi:glycosyltransferase involved in cell wall biosynthesis
LQDLANISDLNVEVTDLALEWMDPEGADTGRAREVLLQLAERARPDVVHLNSYREARFEWPAPVLLVAHSCVMSWWQACFEHVPDDERWRRYAAEAGAGLAAADVWIAPTAAIRDAITAIYHPPTRGRVIWNGIDLLPAAGPKQPYILAAGRAWDEAKNLSRLAAVASELDWPVRVAGATRGPDGSAREPQLASIFAAPAIYEPFGLTVLEAAASGCALVLSDIPSFRELWNESALFIDPRNNDAIIFALQKLSRDPRLRTHMQLAAARRARRYSLSCMASAYTDLYCKMGDRSGSLNTEPRSARTELHP